MKKQYEILSLEIVLCQNEDIVTLSGGEGSNDNLFSIKNFEW